MDVAGWLRGLGLEQYTPAFRDNDIDGEVLRRLTAEDLRELGVASIGHRRRLLDAIGALGAAEAPPAPAPPAPVTPDNKKRAVVEAWYRKQNRKAVPSLIAKWEPVIGVKVEKFFVQKMKTKWGSCNATSKSIRLNTDLAKKPLQCLEYLVVHEIAHLLVRHHNEQFLGLMDKCLPGWRLLRQTLNDAPLAHADWTY